MGTFTTITPAININARIDWGDGSSSFGMLKPLGIIGLDEMKFEIDGPHSYANAGSFGICSQDHASQFYGQDAISSYYNHQQHGFGYTAPPINSRESEMVWKNRTQLMTAPSPKE